MQSGVIIDDHRNSALLNGRAEARVFWRMRWRLIRNYSRQLILENRLQVATVATASFVFWLILFLLFVEGFQFIAQYLDDAPTRDMAISAVISVFFASLMIMLVLSSAIILYSGCYRTREIEFLLTLPARCERVFLFKFQEAMLFSSWGFLLLGSPMLVAYGLVNLAPWYYFLFLVPFLCSFVLIPGAIGALICVVVVHRLPALRMHIAGVTTLGLVVLIGWFAWNTMQTPVGDLMTPRWFNDLLARLRFSEHRLLPSWWLSSGLLAAARREWEESVLFLTLLIANALFLHQLAIGGAVRWYREGLSALYGIRRTSLSLRFQWVDALIARFLFFLPAQSRTLLLKDVRVFRRDPVQWMQFMIFFGLLGLYFANVRRFRYDLHQATWVNMVSFLNLAAVGLILSTFTSRFVFPMISLEGRRFWVLGLLPVDRSRILWTKFLFGAFGSMIPCTVLVGTSDVMLRVVPVVIASHLLTCVMLCLGLSGLAVGLGAKLPNFQEPSPSKIAAGFGGTLNLVLSGLYIVAIVALTAVPSHFLLAAQSTHGPMSVVWSVDDVRMWLYGGLALSVVIGVLTTIVPMRIGLRAFRNLEF